ncbi:hypothetical protein [Parafrankia elaeagni]|uniref:hypothetical protein n=1 Tax=Parafrankia elaeagni TaxID=222534 RepID=UPI00039ABF90|nr:hypothetical protein [Parafrankia elaeagni]
MQVTIQIGVLEPHRVDAVYDAAGYDALDVSIELRGGTTDRIVTIADPQAFELGIALSGGPIPPVRAEARRLRRASRPTAG